MPWLQPRAAGGARPPATSLNKHPRPDPRAALVCLFFTSTDSVLRFLPLFPPPHPAIPPVAFLLRVRGGIV